MRKQMFISHFTDVKVDDIHIEKADPYSGKLVFFSDDEAAIGEEPLPIAIVPGLTRYIGEWKSETICQMFHPLCQLQIDDEVTILPTRLKMPLSYSDGTDQLAFLFQNFFEGNARKGRKPYEQVVEEHYDYYLPNEEDEIIGGTEMLDPKHKEEDLERMNTDLLAPENNPSAYIDTVYYAVSAVISNKCPKCPVQESCQQYQLAGQMLENKNPSVIWFRDPNQ